MRRSPPSRATRLALLLATLFGILCRCLTPDDHVRRWRATQIQNRLFAAAAVLTFLALTPQASVAGFIAVDAKANLFASGQPSAPGGGLVPPVITFSPGSGQTVTFTDVMGILNAGPTVGLPNNGPEGGAFAFGQPLGTNVFSSAGISGLIHDRYMFLAGVFLTDATPVPGTEPGRLDFRGADGFAELTPQIAQTFFIGDGLTGRGNGAVQIFHVPDSATRLYLGFVDAGSFGWPNGAPPGSYADNTGTVTATFTFTSNPLDPPINAVPEPSSLVLLGIGGITALASQWRRRARMA